MLLTVRLLPYPYHADFAGRAGQFVLLSFLLLFILLQVLFFPCFNALTIAVRSCLGMDVHLFLHHALYALRAILCAASLVGQEMLYRFYMYMCTPA